MTKGKLNTKSFKPVNVDLFRHLININFSVAERPSYSRTGEGLKLDVMPAEFEEEVEIFVLQYCVP